MSGASPMFPPADPTRRSFISQAAGLAASASAAVAVVATKATALPADDSALVKLEERIFEQWHGAHAFDAELIGLSDVWQGELQRLYDEVYNGRSTLTVQERWDLVRAMPESKEHDRLVKRQDRFFERMNDLIKRMFATPAHTSEGRRAKVTVLLRCVMGSDWTHVDQETDYAELQARNLLIEFVGGEPGQMLRGQFA
jgi:hypothetical protein